MELVIDTKTLKATIAANVIRLRKLRGWSQTRLAEEVGACFAQINRIEKAHNVPSAELLYSLADVFGVSADSLRQATLQHSDGKIAQTA